MNIFVGNLLFEVVDADVRTLFEGFGSVASVAIVMDKKGVESRGFGFVEMPDSQQAQDAIAALDGKEFMGRPLNVSPAYSKSKPVRHRRKRKEKTSLEVRPVSQQNCPQVDGKQENPLENTGVYKTGRYKTGRRSRSFIKRHSLTEVEWQSISKKKIHDNPMRWRKKPQPRKAPRKGDNEPYNGKKSKGTREKDRRH